MILAVDGHVPGAGNDSRGRAYRAAGPVRTGRAVEKERGHANPGEPGRRDQAAIREREVVQERGREGLHRGPHPGRPDHGHDRRPELHGLDQEMLDRIGPAAGRDQPAQFGCHGDAAAGQSLVDDIRRLVHRQLRDGEAARGGLEGEHGPRRMAEGEC